MKCPHCLVTFHEAFTLTPIGIDPDGGHRLHSTVCAACKRLIVLIASGAAVRSTGGSLVDLREPIEVRLVRPVGASRPLPPEVPQNYRKDFSEAVTVLPNSAKAAAALARRCLQLLLRNAAKVKPSDLSSEIQQVLDGGTLPAHLAEAIDAIRNIGNFAAHPLKSQHTGEILEVEPGEAEWTLDVLESLFDFYFVQPELLKRKREALNQKLKEAGKPAMKGA